MFSNKRVRTNVKGRCVTVKGVKLWDNCDSELKECNKMGRFKKLFKNKTIEKYTR